ncbi:hypothetical protein B0H19DRAFT_900663, partial [Mycena capillaripes]
YGENVEVFRLDRQLAPDGTLKVAAADTKEESHFSLEFRRRICAGLHLANRTLFIEMVTMLWSFTISPGCDAHGN